MATLTSAKHEEQLWQDLMRSKQDYVQALASLDALAFDATAAPLDQRLIDEAAEARRAAYSKYRQAMDQLADFNRK
jgi:hypothetical protein